MCRDLPATKHLSDGTVGYYARAPRMDDCFCAALASCLQVPIGEVPDPRLDERLRAGDAPEVIDADADRELAVWLAERGLRMVEQPVSTAMSWSRWIGIVPLPGWFNSHTLLMGLSRVLFDPTAEIGGGVRVFGARDVRYGYCFAPITN